MPQTPSKVGERVENYLHKLNAEWDLQLPRLHGKSADLAENTAALAKRCASRIRYLCFRLDSLDQLLEEFSERAFQAKSQWITKPRQERGTLPNFPVTKSGLKREVMRSRNLGLTRLDEKQRRQLLEILDVVLEDDYKLARDSDSFSRDSGTSDKVVRKVSVARASTTKIAISETTVNARPPHTTKPPRRSPRQSGQVAESHVEATATPGLMTKEKKRKAEDQKVCSSFVAIEMPADSVLDRVVKDTAHIERFRPLAF
jgi:hypothetical protein